MLNLLRLGLKCAHIYANAWVSTVSTPKKRIRLLYDLIASTVVHLVAINLFRQLLDAEPSYEAPAAYPFSNPSPTLRCLWLFTHFPSSVKALAKAASTSNYPTEMIILAMHIRTAATAFLVVVAPPFFLRRRSYVHLLGLLFTHVIMYASLVTHPRCANSQSLATYITNPAFGLVSQQTVFNVSGADFENWYICLTLCENTHPTHHMARSSDISRRGPTDITVDLHANASNTS